MKQVLCALAMVVSAVSTPLFAAERYLRCQIIDSASESDHVIIELYASGADKQHVRQAYVVKGEEKQNIYSSALRFDREVVYCNPNDNEFVEQTGKVTLYSVCTAKDDEIQQIRSRASVTIEGGGYLRSTVYGKDGQITFSEVNLLSCVLRP